MPREEIRSARSTSPTGSEFFNALQEMSRDWMGRATAEVELGLTLSKKLTAAHSVPDAITAYQEWLSEEMNAALKTHVCCCPMGKSSWMPALDFCRAVGRAAA